MNSKYSGIPLAEKISPGIPDSHDSRSLSPSVYGQRKSYVKLRSIVMGIHYVTPIYSNICKLNQPIEETTGDPRFLFLFLKVQV